MNLHSALDLRIPLTTEELDQEEAWNNTNIKKRNTFYKNYPREIRELVAEKRNIRRQWKQSRQEIQPLKKN